LPQGGRYAAVAGVECGLIVSDLRKNKNGKVRPRDLGTAFD
jgi:hypothetical protein